MKLIIDAEILKRFDVPKITKRELESKLNFSYRQSIRYFKTYEQYGLIKYLGSRKITIRGPATDFYTITERGLDVLTWFTVNRKDGRNVET